MSHTRRRLVAITSLLGRLSMPLALTSAGLFTPACLFGSPGPSNVSQGKQYISGDPGYDGFFAELYQTQLSMGQAPDRERAARERLITALALPPAATSDDIAGSLAKRLAKVGVAVNVEVSGLDDKTAEPKASASASGTAANPKDKAMLAALGDSVREEGALIAEMRKARPTIERLRAQAGGLEPGIDTTFHKGGPRKKSEVSKNVDDAQRIIPLMAVRADDVETAAKDLLTKLAKVAHTEALPPVAESASPAPADSGGGAKKAHEGGKKKKGGGGGEAAGASPAAPKAEAPKPEAPKPAPPKPPPAEDFEP